MGRDFELRIRLFGQEELSLGLLKKRSELQTNGRCIWLYRVSDALMEFVLLSASSD